ASEWPAGLVALRQNTIVNYGKPSEQLVRVTASSTSPSSFDVRENIIVGRFADVPSARYPSTLNTFMPDDSIFVDPANGNFSLVNAITGARNYAPYAYAATASYVVRTDFFRGASPTLALPTYLANRIVGEWFDVLGVGLDSISFPCMTGQGFGRLDQITQYSGGAVRDAGSWFLLKGGGHASTLNNILIGIRLPANCTAWA